MPTRIIVSGGGTGGHIFPAVSIANAVRELRPDTEILFVGALGRMEMERVPQAGYRIVGLPVRGLIRPLWSPRNVGVMIDFLKSRSKVKRVIREFRPQCVVGVGGYASSPTLNAAHAMGIPCVIQEQNSYAGVTNRSLSHKAVKICVAYDGMERFFPRERLVKTGNPVRQALMACTATKAEARQQMGLNPTLPTVLVIGGSLGARTINNAMRAGIPAFEEAGVQVVWQTGKYYADKCEHAVATYYAEAKATGRPAQHLVEAQAFITDMATAYRAADIVISRAGASSISELCLLGKAAILVPSPNVAEDHQTKNARALSDRSAALFCADTDAPEQLVAMALGLVADREKTAAIEAEAARMAFRDSARQIAEIVLAEADKTKGID